MTKWTKGNFKQRQDVIRDAFGDDLYYLVRESIDDDITNITNLLIDIDKPKKPHLQVIRDRLQGLLLVEILLGGRLTEDDENKYFSRERMMKALREYGEKEK